MENAQGAAADAARQFAKTFWSAVTSAQAASVTIALRIPILMQAALDPFAASARGEAARAASEKWEAGVEGAIGAWSATAALWRDSLAHPGDFNAFARGMEAVTFAAMQPATVCVRGNARRLSRPR